MTLTFIFLTGILLALIILTAVVSKIQASIGTQKDGFVLDSPVLTKLKKEVAYTRNTLYAGTGILLLISLAAAYLAIKGTPMEGHFFEWLNLIFRWLHITFGIAWIGASFYFVFLENSLNRTQNLRDELAGNLWAIHGGGFYFLEKYKVAPKKIPEELHWFKYEAYFTWLTGICLLFIVYYFNAKAFLIDPNLLDISPLEGTTIGIATLISGWLIYDFLCKTPLLKKGWLFALCGFLIATGFAYFLSQVFSPRAAYIHFGAMLGTIMAANVFFVIIPSQKAMVRSAKEGIPPDPQLGKYAGLRSLHNNYLTLPVLFVMISNHFPSTFGHPHNWAVLAAISLASAGVKHFLNLQERGEYSVWILPVSICILLGAVLVTSPNVNQGECKSGVSFTEIYPIISTRCTPCHSAQPTDEIWSAPPNGVKYDTPEEVKKMAERIMQRVVITKTMPPNNKTGMTPAERDLIRCWIEQGANVSQ